MRALVNDNVEGFSPRLNTSSDISNEGVIDQPRLLEPLPTRLEKRKSENIDILTFILGKEDMFFP